MTGCLDCPIGKAQNKEGSPQCDPCAGKHGALFLFDHLLRRFWLCFRHLLPCFL
jgi:hypothetical protein